jgi:hypothetical protein
MLEPNGHRPLQRSQSLQPSLTVSAAAVASTQQQQQHSQYHQLQQQKFYLNNYTNHHKPNSAPHANISRINSSPASATITSEQHHQQKQLPAPLNFPIQISYNIDGSSSGVIESPAVKIDYSQFTLPATSPSIKIDLSNFNQQATKPSTSTSGLIDEDYDDY